MSHRNSFLSDPTKLNPPRNVCVLCGCAIRSSPFQTYPVTEPANKRFLRFAHAVCAEAPQEGEDEYV